MQKDKKENKSIQTKREKNIYPDYPVYRPDDDIYVKHKEATEADPENVTALKQPNEAADEENKSDDFEEAIPGNDLDVPGSELDDEAEKIGSEDEENNYYSVGGDNHNDLEEDKTD